MLGAEPEEWTYLTWCLAVLGALYLVGFFAYWVRFQRAERAAKGGEPGAVERFNAMLRGFPNAMYAKMFGKRPFEAAKADEGRA